MRLLGSLLAALKKAGNGCSEPLAALFELNNINYILKFIRLVKRNEIVEKKNSPMGGRGQRNGGGKGDWKDGLVEVYRWHGM